MKNPYSIFTSRLRGLWIARQKMRLTEQIFKHAPLMTLQEMHDEMERDSGVFHEAISTSIKEFTRKTENTEIVVAMDLAEFYFPNLDPLISFEMKSSFLKRSDLSYEELVEGISCDTHVDCSIATEGKKFDFQIKRYPEEYLPLTNEALVDYMVKASGGYGSMTGTILIVLLQPIVEDIGKPTLNPRSLNFQEIHQQLMSHKDKDKLTFDEIDFIFNDRNQRLLWHQVYPDCGYSEKPLILISEKYRKIQEKLKDQ